MVLNHNLKENQWLKKSETEILIVITITIPFFMPLATTMLNMMILIRRKKKFLEKFFSKSVLEKMKREISLNNKIIHLMGHKIN